MFFVPDAEAVDLAALGPALEHHALFPRPRQYRGRAGAGAGADPHARLGTRRGHHARPAAAAPAPRWWRRPGAAWPARTGEVLLDGGPLAIDWRDDDHVVMTGPVAVSFAGTLDAALLP